MAVHDVLGVYWRTDVRGEYEGLVLVARSAAFRFSSSWRCRCLSRASSATAPSRTVRRPFLFFGWENVSPGSSFPEPSRRFLCT